MMSTCGQLLVSSVYTKRIPGKQIQHCAMLHFVVENFKSVMKLGKNCVLNYVPAYKDPLKIIVEHVSAFMMQKVLHNLN